MNCLLQGVKFEFARMIQLAISNQQSVVNSQQSAVSNQKTFVDARAEAGG